MPRIYTRIFYALVCTNLYSTPNTVFKTHSRCDNTSMAYQTFAHQIWWVMVCYDLAHQIRWAKHTFSGWCDITPMVCCSFGGHSTPQFLQCTTQQQIKLSIREERFTEESKKRSPIKNQCRRIAEGRIKKMAKMEETDRGTCHLAEHTPAVTIVQFDQRTLEAIVAGMTAQLRESGELRRVQEGHRIRSEAAGHSSSQDCLRRESSIAQTHRNWDLGLWKVYMNSWWNRR